jgi:hypothetical protein
MLKIFPKLKNHKRTATSKSKFQSGWKLEEVGGLALGTVHTSTLDHYLKSSYSLNSSSMDV